jgi:hypothetical protein
VAFFVRACFLFGRASIDAQGIQMGNRCDSAT